MSTIIKAADAAKSIHSIAFNFEDVSRDAERYLAKIREQAGQILLKAQAEANELRKQAEIDGRRAGEAQVDQKVKAQVETMFQTLVPAVHQAVRELEQARGAWLVNWERQAIELSAAMAARVLRRELQHDPQLPLALIREALSLAATSNRVRLRLSPADHATLGQQAAQLAASIASVATCEIIADATIEPGGCRLETEQGVIDQQFSSQLARLREELI